MTENITIDRQNRVCLNGAPSAWFVQRGAYQGTTDDRLDRWYPRCRDDESIDRRGPGHRTRQEAGKAAAEQINLAAAHD